MKHYLLLLVCLHSASTISMEKRKKKAAPYAAYYIVHHKTSCEKSDGEKTWFLECSKNECPYHDQIISNIEYKQALSEGMVVAALYRENGAVLGHPLISERTNAIYQTLNNKLIKFQKMLNELNENKQ
ncbi:MAG: hypothetical protein BWY54_00710 [Candidatus Dependentiae bacterium ADurb.Bin331]|nr:MAG: hypothetical protein BWY54_00710 [Candidatus Dependentiae bacterium ADurb.Bin331]